MPVKPQSITEKRSKAAARQRRKRARDKANGIPPAHLMERVMLEATAFALNRHVYLQDGTLDPAVAAIMRDMRDFAIYRLVENHGIAPRRAHNRVRFHVRERAGHRQHYEGLPQLGRHQEG